MKSLTQIRREYHYSQVRSEDRRINDYIARKERVEKQMLWAIILTLICFAIVLNLILKGTT